jgi:hypothetical protein
LDLDLCADFDSELVWFLALLADFGAEIVTEWGEARRKNQPELL